MLLHPENTPECNRDFPSRVDRIAESLSAHDQGPFPIFHPDFGNHNFLVDDLYNIIGLIDWGGSIALPREFIHNFPTNLRSLHDVFWRNGPLDGPLARKQDLKEKAEQSYYLNSVQRGRRHVWTMLGISRESSGDLGLKWWKHYGCLKGIAQIICQNCSIYLKMSVVMAINDRADRKGPILLHKKIPTCMYVRMLEIYRGPLEPTRLVPPSLWTWFHSIVQQFQWPKIYLPSEYFVWSLGIEGICGV